MIGRRTTASVLTRPPLRPLTPPPLSPPSHLARPVLEVADHPYPFRPCSHRGGRFVSYVDARPLSVGSGSEKELSSKNENQFGTSRHIVPSKIRIRRRGSLRFGIEKTCSHHRPQSGSLRHNEKGRKVISMFVCHTIASMRHDS